MPNKCRKCGFIFCDDINILKGCPFCDSKNFIYLNKNTNYTKIENKIKNINLEINNKYEKDIETIKIINPGSYELNLDHIFKKKDIVIELKEEGKYAIDLSSVLKKNKK